LWESGADLRFSRVLTGTARPGGAGFLAQVDLGRRWIELAHAPGSRAALAEIEARCVRREAFSDAIVARADAGGRLRHFALSGAPVQAPDGAFLGYRGAVRDVTSIVEREQRLRAVMHEAEAASATKTEFITTISHELRSPLNSVIGFAEVMSREILGPMGSPRYVGYARDIGTAGQHMLSLVNDILGIAKLEAGQQALEESEFELETIVAESVALARGQAERSGVTIEIISATWPRLRADARAMRQMLVNLLNNAIRFSDHGGRVELETAFVVDHGGTLRLTVRDFGVGIAPEELPALGRPFVQLRAGRERGGGSGLGLTIVRHLAELHGGRLELASRPGHGTAANLSLPATRLVTRPPLLLPVPSIAPTPAPAPQEVS
jgi:signal transduction histidine kinase